MSGARSEQKKEDKFFFLFFFKHRRNIILILLAKKKKKVKIEKHSNKCMSIGKELYRAETSCLKRQNIF